MLHLPRYSQFKQDALEQAKRYFERASSDSIYTQWRANAMDDFAFFDGTKQYPESILAKLRARGQEPIVVNKVKPMIYQVAGLEINTRYKIGYRSHSFDEQQALLAKALTHYGLAIQEKESFSYYGSLKFRDALICGLGWSGLFHLKNGDIAYQYIHPMDMIFETSDFSPQLTNMQRVVCMRWMSPIEIKNLYPKSSAFLHSFEDDLCQWTDDRSEALNRQSSIPASSTSSIQGGKLLVVELQHKVNRTFYTGFDISTPDKGDTYLEFKTFEEEEAISLAGKASSVTQEKGTQIMRTVFCGDMLLEHAPLLPNIPNMKDFSYIPLVWERRMDNGMPVGWLKSLKDLQRELNYRKLKEMNALNSVRALIDPRMLKHMKPEQIRAELARPDSILFKSGESDNSQIIQNTDISANQIKAAERLDYELQQVSGQYNDALGDQSNATSGIAIRQRQSVSNKNLAYGFDSAMLMKKREGRKLLELIQAGMPENVLIELMDEDEQHSLVLNMVRMVGSKKQIYNNIRTLPVSIYVEAMPDYESSPEEREATIEALLANPNAALILQNQALLKLLPGLSKYADNIAAVSQQVQMQQAAPRMAPATQTPQENI